MRAGVRAGDFLTQNDENVREHQAAEEYRGDSDPFLASDKSVDRDRVEGPIKQYVQPDRILPPLRASHQEGVQSFTVLVDQANHGRGRPDRLYEMVRIRDDELFDIHDIRDEK